MLLAVVVLVAVVLAIAVRGRRARLVDQIPGPPALPIIGNTLQLNVERDDVFDRLTGTTLLWGHSRGIARAWMGTSPYVLLSRPHVIEPILSSNKHIDKSKDYVYLRPWLGTGLLTSGGSKWHARRKVLTPAFHFKILEDFIDVFREQSDVLVERLQQEVGQEAFDIFPYVTLCTLDIICEAQLNHLEGTSYFRRRSALFDAGRGSNDRSDCISRLRIIHPRHWFSCWTECSHSDASMKSASREDELTNVKAPDSLVALPNKRIHTLWA